MKPKGMPQLILAVVFLAFGVYYLYPKANPKKETGTSAEWQMAEVHLKLLANAVELFKSHKLAYPRMLEELTEPGEDGKPFLNKIPPDPWGRPYFYLWDSGTYSYTLGSFGADGEPGGEGADADIMHTMEEQHSKKDPSEEGNE